MKGLERGTWQSENSEVCSYRTGTLLRRELSTFPGTESSAPHMGVVLQKDDVLHWNNTYSTTFRDFVRALETSAEPCLVIHYHDHGSVEKTEIMVTSAEDFTEGIAFQRFHWPYWMEGQVSIDKIFEFAGFLLGTRNYGVLETCQTVATTVATGGLAVCHVTLLKCAAWIIYVFWIACITLIIFLLILPYVAFFDHEAKKWILWFTVLCLGGSATYLALATTMAPRIALGLHEFGVKYGLGKQGSLLFGYFGFLALYVVIMWSNDCVPEYVLFFVASLVSLVLSFVPGLPFFAREATIAMCLMITHFLRSGPAGPRPGPFTRWLRAVAHSIGITLFMLMQPEAACIVLLLHTEFGLFDSPEPPKNVVDAQQPAIVPSVAAQPAQPAQPAAQPAAQPVAQAVVPPAQYPLSKINSSTLFVLLHIATIFLLVHYAGGYRMHICHCLGF